MYKTSSFSLGFLVIFRSTRGTFGLGKGLLRFCILTVERGTSEAEKLIKSYIREFRILELETISYKTFPAPYRHVKCMF